MVKTSRNLSGQDYKQLMIRLFDKRKPGATIDGIWRYWKRQKERRGARAGIPKRMKQGFKKLKIEGRTWEPRSPDTGDDARGSTVASGDEEGYLSEHGPALLLSKASLAVILIICKGKMGRYGDFYRATFSFSLSCLFSILKNRTLNRWRSFSMHEYSPDPILIGCSERVIPIYFLICV